MNMTNKLPRESNLELLRLFSMLLITVYHFSGALPPSAALNGAQTVLHIGVVCFVLISGYFGIKTKIKGLIRLFGVIAFYGFSLYVVSVLWNGDTWDKMTLFRSFLPFSNNFYWFIFYYAQLYLIAPLLNKAIERMSRRDLLLTLLVFFYLCIYIGIIWYYNRYTAGKSLLLFIFIYLIGRYLRLYSPIAESTRRRTLRRSLCAWAAIAAIAYVGCVFTPPTVSGYVYRFSFHYNSPLLILMAIAVFNVFRCIKLQNKTINWMATSALAVYLIHEHPYIKEQLYVAPIAHFNSTHPTALTILFIVGYALAIFFTCILIDKIRVQTVKLLHLEKISEACEKKIEQIIEYIKKK